MASQYGELVVDLRNNTINGEPWPVLKAVYEPNSPCAVSFWALSEEYIAEVSKLPISWYLDEVKRLSEGLETMEPKRLADSANMLAISAQSLHVRVMADLTKDAPARKLKSPISDTGTSSPAGPSPAR